MVDVVYDAGALIAAERDDLRMWSLHRRIVERGAAVFVPATVLTEVWRGSADQHALAALLRSCSIDELTEDRARRAGFLLSKGPYGAVDASVVECALRRHATCVSGNREHLRTLAEPARLNIVDV